MNNLSAQWASLGITFSVKSELTSPEEALLSLIKSGEFPEDKKMLSLAIMWLNEYSNLVHIERLKNMSLNLTAFEKAVLCAISKKMTTKGDLRWAIILKKYSKELKNVKFDIGNDSVIIKMKGHDLDFSEFGIAVAPLIAADNKKMFSRSKIISNNIWLKNRLLFGTNVRADIATLIQLKLVKNGYEAAKKAHCSMTAAYRNFSNLKEAGL